VLLTPDLKLLKRKRLNRLTQLRTDGVAMAFFCLSVIVFIYVGFGSCASYVQAWLGEAPCHYAGLPADFTCRDDSARPRSSRSMLC